MLYSDQTQTKQIKTECYNLESVEANTWLSDDAPERTIKQKKHKTVAFGTVQIREHNVVIASPSFFFDDKVVPLQLGWDYVQHPTLSIDEHENNRSRYYRSREDLVLTPKMRLIKLSQVGGYTDKQLMKAQRSFLQKERSAFFTTQHMG
mmetsp:Transcript_19396/g.29174  ORF Transcript_19396/g.29174 Transcript_19396/m.29174 type:complete len:149 (-) Transcript_19396:277-723(-)